MHNCIALLNVKIISDRRRRISNDVSQHTLQLRLTFTLALYLRLSQTAIVPLSLCSPILLSTYLLLLHFSHFTITLLIHTTFVIHSHLTLHFHYTHTTRIFDSVLSQTHFQPVVFIILFFHWIKEQFSLILIVLSFFISGDFDTVFTKHFNIYL